MDGRPLPGFYYDQEKKKYFRITANHTAPPDSKYSKSAVKKEKEALKKRKRDEEFTRRRNVQTIRRPPVLQSSHSQASLGREQGRMPFSLCQKARAAAWISQIERRPILEIEEEQGSSNSRQDIIYDFVIDPAHEGLIFASGRSGECSSKLDFETTGNEDESTYDQLAAFHSETSSISFSAGRVYVATALNTYPKNVFMGRLPLGRGYDGELDWEDNSHEDPDLIDGIYINLANPITTLWTSATNPPGAVGMVIIGASFNKVDSHYRGTCPSTNGQAFVIGTEDQKMHHRINFHGEVRAVDWLNTSTAIVGTTCAGPSWKNHKARGEIALLDPRVREAANCRFQHEVPIFNIKGLGNGHTILASGPGVMSTYDVRMPTTPGGSAQHLLRMETRCTMPNSTVDIWPSGNVVAFRDDANVVQLHSLLDGRRIRSLTTGGAAKGTEAPWVRRVRFLDDARGETHLWTCQGRVVERWGCDDTREEHCDGA